MIYARYQNRTLLQYNLYTSRYTFSIARFGVTEIGEKEKMKSKILATIVVLALLLGTFAVAYRATPNTMADTLYHLDVYSDPSAVPASPGAGDYTFGTLVQMNFTDPYVDGNVKYVFQSWDIDAGTWTGTSNPLQYITMNADHNVTAHYKTQYMVSLGANPFGATDWIWSTSTGWVLTNSLWVDAGDQAKIGVEGLSIIVGPKPGIWTDPYHRWAYCDSFDGDFSGYYNDAVSAWSDPVTVNKAKTGTSIWAFYYALYVNSDPNPPVTPPAGQNYYTAGSVVSLTANDYSTNFAVYRYTLDHWTVDGSTEPGNPISVTMDWNKTAVAFYKRQSFVYLKDNIGNISEIEDTGKWYDDGVPYEFEAPPDIGMAWGFRYVFKFWDKPGYGWTSTDNPLFLTFDASWDGEKLRARYQGQYYLELKSNPPLAGFLNPGSSVTGWYDWGSTQSMDAKTEIIIDADLKYVFKNWTNNYGWSGTGNSYTFGLDKPYVETAYYDRMYHLKWNHSPSSLTVTGSPGETWLAEGTDIWYGAQPTDTTGKYVFYYWFINGVQYAYNDVTVHVGTLTAPVDGTAYYVEATKIFMDPAYHEETAPAYCHEFDVTVYASNFDANRLVGGRSMDIYAFDIGIKWDKTLIELKSVSLNLADFFDPNPFFYVEDKSTPGYYSIIATVKGSSVGFVGTKAMFTMRFHVIYDACFNYQPWTWIEFDPAKRVLSNHDNQQISPELGWKDCYYKMKNVMPVLDIRNAADGTHLVKVDWNKPQVFFDVDVWLLNGVKVHDFWVKIDYNELQIEVDKVVIADYLSAPYTAYTWWKSGGFVYVWVAQDVGVSLKNGTGKLFTITFKVVNQLFYKSGGPFVLQSDIVVMAGTYLSVNCGVIYQQDLGTLLGATGCHYLYNPIPGDLDFDGCVTVLDLQLIIQDYGGNYYDVYTDGKTDLFDLVFVALRYGTCAPGKVCP